MDLKDLTILKAQKGLKEKKFSARELCKAFLEKAKKEDSKIHSFLSFNERLLEEKSEGELAGIPFAVKDNILVEGLKCTAGSKILENYIAPYSATVIKRLKEKGALVLGKTNLDEFAMGASTEFSAFGPTKNPLDPERVPGGSSGGSAAAVAAGFAVFALGSDTGGSIRQPAGFCGVVGLKPTYGSVSRSGLIAMASSLDQIGPITKTVEDAEIVFDVIKGKDKLDSTSVKLSEKDFKKKDFKIGIPKEYFIEGIDSEVEKSIKEAISKIEKQGAKIEEISLPHCTDKALAVYYIIMPSEASSNLARYDGMRYGFSKKSDNLLDVYLNSRSEGFGEEVRRRIMLGTYALSSGYYEAYYLRAQKVRTKIREDFEKAFKKVDVIITPTSPDFPFKIGERTKDPLSMYLSDIFVGAVNLAGTCALSIPLKGERSLPASLQIIGKPFEEKTILQVGKIFERII